MKQILHSYGIATKVFKVIFSLSGFFFPVIMVIQAYIDSPERLAEISSNSVLLVRFLRNVIVYWLLMLPTILVAAYCFSDITTDNDGLLVEFLWTKLRVKWDEVIAIKPAFHWDYPRSNVIFLLWF